MRWFAVMQDGNYFRSLPGQARIYPCDDGADKWNFVGRLDERGALRVGGDEVIDAGAQLASSNSIRSLFAAPDGSLWIGNAGWDWAGSKMGSLRPLASDRGLADDYISEIISDGRGWLWCGADHGIFKVREQDLNLAMDDPHVRVQSVCYGRGDGLLSLQANFDEFQCMAHPWREAFAADEFLAVVDPAQLHGGTEPPPRRCSIAFCWMMCRLQLMAGAVPAAAGVDLPAKSAGHVAVVSHSHHRLEFDFAVLSFNAPENIAIEYRLDRFDDKWVDARAQRKAIYSQLAPGDYRFEVRARNSDGVWGKQNAAFAFSVAPFFWQTLWFRFATVALFMLTMIASVRYVSFRRLQSKVRVLEQQAALDKERARIARDIHDHLGGTLTQMKLQLELALRNGAKPEKIERHVQKSLSAARQAIQSLDETVWAVNPNNDTLSHLVQLHRRGIRGRISWIAPRFVAGVDLPNAITVIPGFHRGAASFIFGHKGGTEQRRPSRRRQRSANCCASVKNNGSLKFTRWKTMGMVSRPTSGKSLREEGLHGITARSRWRRLVASFIFDEQARRGSFLSCPWRASGETVLQHGRDGALAFVRPRPQQRAEQKYAQCAIRCRCAAERGADSLRRAIPPGQRGGQSIILCLWPRDVL